MPARTTPLSLEPKKNNDYGNESREASKVAGKPFEVVDARMDRGVGVDVGAFEMKPSVALVTLDHATTVKIWVWALRHTISHVP